jgi:hypothetical protein
VADDRTIRHPTTLQRRDLLQRHRRVIAEVADRGQFGREKGGSLDRMLTYWDRPDSEMPAGDPASEDGVKVAFSELSPDLQAMLSGGQLLEAVYVFPDEIAPNTSVNVQSGAYMGGGPAVISGDLLSLPSSGAVFRDDGRIFVLLNGQELLRGAFVGQGEAYWISATQIALNLPLTVFPGNVLTIRVPSVL